MPERARSDNRLQPALIDSLQAIRETVLAAASLDHFDRRLDLTVRFQRRISSSLLLLMVFGVFACDPIESARVDECLDRGGSYDYQAGVCDFETSHPVP